jgi:hypothetical protein
VTGTVASKERRIYPASRRSEYGLTVGLLDEETGDRKYVHVMGAPMEAARTLAASIEGSNWKVDVVSTPQSILSDLRGRPNHNVTNGPERLLLRIGRGDLLSEKLRDSLRRPRAKKPRGHAWRRRLLP